MTEDLGDKTGSTRFAPEAAGASSPSVTIPIARQPDDAKRLAEAAALAAIPQDAVERAAHVLATNGNIKYREAPSLARSMLYVSMLPSDLTAERAKSEQLRAEVEHWKQRMRDRIEQAALSSSPSPSPQLSVGDRAPFTDHEARVLLFQRHELRTLLERFLAHSEYSEGEYGSRLQAGSRLDKIFRDTREALLRSHDQWEQRIDSGVPSPTGREEATVANDIRALEQANSDTEIADKWEAEYRRTGPAHLSEEVCQAIERNHARRESTRKAHATGQNHAGSGK
jgi:hypothetical protein